MTKSINLFFTLLLFSFSIQANLLNPHSDTHEKSLQGDNSAYDQWAANYDKDLHQWNWNAPKIVVDSFYNEAKAHHIAISANTRILDAGTGTGLVGELLREKGFNGNLTGVDLNAAMIDQSHKKQYNNQPVYNKLTVADLIDLPKNPQYDIILSSGVFLEGHCGPQHLSVLLNTMAPEGMAIITIRKTFYDKHQSAFEKVLAPYQSKLSLAENYIEGASAYVVTLTNKSFA